MKISLKSTHPSRLERPPVSLRAVLQGGTVLAVLAGYALLVAANLTLAHLERRQVHRELVRELSTAVVLRARSPAQFPAVANDLLMPGLQLELAAPGPQRLPRLIAQGDRLLLKSATPVTFADGGRRSLLLLQDVTEAIRRQEISLKLLSASAGLAALVTALLLRPVMQRGLVRPLKALSEQLSSYRLPPSQPLPLNLADQPVELQPIAAAFNAMLDRLTTSWERQRSFVDGVAHELRTPITLISGHAQSLQRSAAAAALGPSLTLISAEARRMGALVSDMLDLARQDAGRLELRRQRIDLEDVLLESFERLAPGTMGRLRLEPPAADGVLPLACGDPGRLEQCLAALVDNALRYAPQGPITLSADLGEGELLLHVRDCGPGVVEAEREAIFERFVRGRAAVDTRGSGIGLSVARLLMRAMGGQLTVGEASGGGADFRLHLQPWSEPPSEVAPPSA
jgi:two-component system OmpR family sensor kinase